jgi:hypothetical protein
MYGYRLENPMIQDCPAMRIAFLFVTFCSMSVRS